MKGMFKTCSNCGAHLDHGERCDCEKKEKPGKAATLAPAGQKPTMQVYQILQRV